MNRYTTIQGDTWDSIAFKIYGDEYKVQLLMEANREYMDIFVFSGGLELKCPELTPAQIIGLPEWRL